MHFDIACALHTHRFVLLSFCKSYLLVCFIFLRCPIFCSAWSFALPDLLLCPIFSYGLSCFVKYILASISFWKIVCAFDVQVFVYTCAPLSDEFETTDSKLGFGQQNQFCVSLRSVLFLQKTLSNGDDDRIGFFDFFTIEKREPLQHVFLYVEPQSTINRISTSTPRSTLHYHFIQTPLLFQHYISMLHTYQCRTHIDIASISLYCNLLSIRLLDTLLYKTIILRNIISTSVSRNTDNTRALHPCHNTACFVTARLAVQPNGIVQNHSTCHYVATTHCIFPKPSSITLIVATVFSKTVALNSYRFILYIGILGVIDMLQSCAQPQDYFRCHQPTACFAQLYLASRQALFTFYMVLFQKELFCDSFV